MIIARQKEKVEKRKIKKKMRESTLKWLKIISDKGPIKYSFLFIKASIITFN